MQVVVRSHDAEADAQALAPLLRAYLVFITADIRRSYGLTYDPEAILADGLRHLDKVIPPKGRCLSAGRPGEAPLGLVMLRRIRPDAVEVKRLFVRPEGRGLGVARALLDRIEDEARAMGADWIYLDSTRNLDRAIAIYRARGFVDTEPYPESDLTGMPDLAPHAVFLRKRLAP